MEKVYLGAFPSEVRPESVTAGVLACVREHCDNRTISVGIQSGSNRMLELLRRGHTVQEAVRAVARIARGGFTPQVDFIFGLPGETDRDQALTRELMLHLARSYGAKVHAHVFAALPGSALADEQPTPVPAPTWELLEQLRGRGLATGACTAEAEGASSGSARPGGVAAPNDDSARHP